MEKHDIPFCRCCPAGGLDLAKPGFVISIGNFAKIKSSFDALDGLLRPDQPRVVGAVLNNSF